MQVQFSNKDENFSSYIHNHAAVPNSKTVYANNCTNNKKRKETTAQTLKEMKETIAQILTEITKKIVQTIKEI